MGLCLFTLWGGELGEIWTGPNGEDARPFVYFIYLNLKCNFVVDV